MEVALLSWGSTATPEAAQYRQDPAPRAHTPTSMGAQRIDFLEPLIRHIVDDSSTKHNCSTFKMGGTHFLCLPTLSVYKIGTHFSTTFTPFSVSPFLKSFLIQWISIEFSGTAAVFFTCISNVGKPECAISPFPVILFPNKGLWCPWFLLPAEGQFSLQMISKEQ